jgi:Tol biopolymer transport system component
VWSTDGRTIIVAAHEWSSPGSHPLWAVSWPDGATRRITSDSNSYNDAPMVLSADGQTITTALIRADVSLYGAPADRPDEAAPLPGDAPEHGFLTPLPGGRLLYRAFDRGPRALWTMASDGTRRQRITTERMDVNAVAVATRADVIVVETSEGLAAVRRLWRMDSSGGGLAELPGGGSVQVLSVSPDGAHLFYRKRDPATSTTSSEVWRRPIGGGDEESVGDRPPVFSPDGRLFYRLIERTTAGPRQVEIAEVATGRVLKTLTTPSPDFSNIRWAPSSDALLGVPRPETVANIWRVPIDGGEATQLTRFGPGQFIPSFTYTADGRLLFLRPERASGEVVQFRNFR